MESILVDELKLYRGDDFKVNELLTLHTPTLGEICDYGEMAYFSMIHSFTGTPADLMWQLDDIGIDYTAISDWELFYQVLYHQFRPEVTGILFGDFDFSSLKPYIHQDSGEAVSYTHLDVYKRQPSVCSRSHSSLKPVRKT